jgi:alpha-glucoside transport system permease protein
MSDFLAKLATTLLTVLIAVGVSGAIWAIANLLVNRLRETSTRATVVSRAVLGFVVAGLLSGNRLTQYSTTEPDAGIVRSVAQWAWLPVVTAALLFLVASVAERQTSRTRRLLVYVPSAGAVGAALGALMHETARPAVELVPTATAVIGGALLFGGIGALARRSLHTDGLVRDGALGTALGVVFGAWGIGELGSVTSATTLTCGVAIGGLVGLRWALSPSVTAERRNATERRARAAVFLAPALGFIAIALVIPSLRTIYLSLLDRRSEKYVGLENYIAIFREPKSWDASRLGELWTSRLTLAALLSFVMFCLLALRGRRRSGHAVEFGSPSMVPLGLTVLFACFAVFSTLRGTLVNNLWWVFVVTSFATVLGLLIAVLADGIKFERTAKAIIFMPLAVSMVGASVIWRLVYISRDASKPQSGTLNALWVGLGSLSTGKGAASVVFGSIVLVLALLALLVLSRHLVKREWSKTALPAALAAFGIWFSLRYWHVIGTGIGGHRFDKSGEVVADPINFLQEPPFNNFWLMVVLIWTETGFAMVIFSAAIRAVPRELTEAARVDGANPQQIFWRITLPQIAPTIGVVATTIMVLVMKVFDIAKVMTNGNFGTEVLANNMYREAFYNLDIGLGASLAVLIFVSVLPIMYLNIRRMTRVA